MRWMFLSIWVLAIVGVTSLVWLMKAPSHGQYTYYTSVISETDGVDSVSVFGKVLIEKETTVVPLHEGRVTQVFVKAGDHVKKDQILATMDFSEKDLQDYRELEKLSLEVGKAEDLNKMLADISALEKKGFYDALEASKKRSEVYSAISQFMTYKLNLKKLFEQTHGKLLTAPFDGVVTDVRLREGQRISLKDEKEDILIGVAPENYKVAVELEVGDELLHKFQKDQYFSVNLPLSNELYVEGKITAVSHQVYSDKRKRYFKVLGVLDHKASALKKLASGMRVLVNVKTSADEDWTWIPRAAFDIHLDDSQIASTLNFTGNLRRDIASTKVADFNQEQLEDIDEQKSPSSVSRMVGNEIFPEESNQTEIYLLTANNRVIKAKVTKVSESGEMVAVQGKELRGMRVITHYVPKESLW